MRTGRRWEPVRPAAAGPNTVQRRMPAHGTCLSTHDNDTWGLRVTHSVMA